MLMLHNMYSLLLLFVFYWLNIVAHARGKRDRAYKYAI